MEKSIGDENKLPFASLNFQCTSWHFCNFQSKQLLLLMIHKSPSQLEVEKHSLYLSMTGRNITRLIQTVWDIIRPVFFTRCPRRQLFLFQTFILGGGEKCEEIVIGPIQVFFFCVRQEIQLSQRFLYSPHVTLSQFTGRSFH